MKSFRLHVNSRRELLSWGVGALVGCIVVGAFYWLGWLEKGWLSILLGVIASIGSLPFTQFQTRYLRAHYPKAKWIALPSIGLTLVAVYVPLHFFVSNEHLSVVASALLMPAGIFIGFFIGRNWRDPDVRNREISRPDEP